MGLSPNPSLPPDYPVDSGDYIGPDNSTSTSPQKQTGFGRLSSALKALQGSGILKTIQGVSASVADAAGNRRPYENYEAQQQQELQNARQATQDQAAAQSRDLAQQEARVRIAGEQQRQAGYETPEQIRAAALADKKAYDQYQIDHPAPIKPELKEDDSGNMFSITQGVGQTPMAAPVMKAMTVPREDVGAVPSVVGNLFRTPATAVSPTMQTPGAYTVPGNEQLTGPGQKVAPKNEEEQFTDQYLSDNKLPATAANLLKARQAYTAAGREPKEPREPNVYADWKAQNPGKSVEDYLASTSGARAGGTAEAKEKDAWNKEATDSANAMSIARQEAAQNTGPGDIALVMQFVSVVKPENIGKMRWQKAEQDFVLGARSTVMDVQATINRIKGGQLLPPQQRQQMLQAMQIYSNAASRTAQQGEAGSSNQSAQSAIPKGATGKAPDPKTGKMYYHDAQGKVLGPVQ